MTFTSEVLLEKKQELIARKTSLLAGIIDISAELEAKKQEQAIEFENFQKELLEKRESERANTIKDLDANINFIDSFIAENIVEEVAVSPSQESNGVLDYNG